MILYAPCVFIKKIESEYVNIAIYVDDINLIGTPEMLIKAMKYVKKEFEMKVLGKIKDCLGLQIEHNSNGVLIHQTTYTEKLLKRFNMDKCHPLSTSMMVRSVDVKNDSFRPKEGSEKVLGPEVPYLVALLYLAQYTRPDITFAINLLARFSSEPTKRHWTGVKHVLRYLPGTTNMGLFFSKDSSHCSQRRGYADVGAMASLATADVCDANPILLSKGDIRVLQPIFQPYGQCRAFSGPIVTLKVFEDNVLVRELLETPGDGRVLVIDGGGSMRCALVGGNIGQLAQNNGWAGILVNGCIRDADEINACDIGVRALGSHPLKSNKKGAGDKYVSVIVAGTVIHDGEWLYADSDGILISKTELTL